MLVCDNQRRTQIKWTIRRDSSVDEGFNLANLNLKSGGESLLKNFSRPSFISPHFKAKVGKYSVSQDETVRERQRKRGEIPVDSFQFNLIELYMFSSFAFAFSSSSRRLNERIILVSNSLIFTSFLPFLTDYLSTTWRLSEAASSLL